MRAFIALFLLTGMLQQSSDTQQRFWTDPAQLTRLGNERISASDFREGIALLETAAAIDPKSENLVASLGNAFHLQRRLDEASLHYARLLQLSPVQPLDQRRKEAIFRYVPRVFQVASDPFPLKDAVAIHHPTEPLIAYHFFWEDDIDFPEDNDPCDHEVVWVQYDPTSNRVVEFTTYFHGRNLVSAAAVEDAHRNGERPRLNVQWGKHGSLPYGWENISTPTDNRATYDKLHTEGRRLPQHPLGRAWPQRFEGSWQEFVAFNREVDIRSILEKTNKMAVSKWNNATIQQHFLPYNFRPKTEWPGGDAEEWTAIRRSAGRTLNGTLPRVSDGRLPEDLPQASLFKPETPRYPNVWFYGAVSKFGSYDAFIESVSKRLRDAGFDPDEVSLNEGADLALSIEHLQPWDALQRLAHSHAIHIRLFWKRLISANAQRATLRDGSEAYWRIAGSVHYEVEHANPWHADVVVCPFCGRTGGYADGRGSLVEEVHDPLGLELLLWGTVRGESLPGMTPRNLKSMELEMVTVGQPVRRDMNTNTIAVVIVR